MRAIQHARRPATSVEYALPHHGRSPRWARMLTGEFLSGTLYENSPSRGDAQLVVSELVANATEHGESPCRLRLHITAAALTVEVHDDSPRMPRSPVAGSSAERGRGLAMVRCLAEDFRVARTPHGGKTVRAVLAAS